MADDLYMLLRQAEPLAKLILALPERLKDLNNLERTLEAKNESIRAAALQLQKVLTKLSEARDELSATQSKAVEARSEADSILAQAREHSEGLVATAQASADEQIRRIKLAAQNEIDALDKEIAQRLKRVEELDSLIAARQADHNAVLDSMGSLKARLG